MLTSAAWIRATEIAHPIPLHYDLKISRFSLLFSGNTHDLMRTVLLRVITSIASEDQAFAAYGKRVELSNVFIPSTVVLFALSIKPLSDGCLAIEASRAISNFFSSSSRTVLVRTPSLVSPQILHWKISKAFEFLR